MLRRSNCQVGSIATDGRAITTVKAEKAPQQYLSEIRSLLQYAKTCGIGLASTAFISIRSPDRGRKAIFRGHRDRARQATARDSSNAGSRRSLRARDGSTQRCLRRRQIRFKKTQDGALEPWCAAALSVFARSR